MSKMIARMDSHFYPAVNGNWDDQIFAERIHAVLRANDNVLDLGAGAGIIAVMNFRGKARRICGIDLDPRVIDNPYLDEGQVCDANSIPYPDNSFDLIFSDNVFEHLEQPELVLKEAARVLKPGGRLLFKTPNRWHYMPLIARMTPHRFHQFINRLRGRDEVDTFPTVYRANTPHDVQELANRSGFVVRRVELIESRPEYLRITAMSYLFGIAYERLVNCFSGLAQFRILLIADLQKPTSETP
ncbi:MAG: class I SAM-dependent methyltransferase [Sphingobium sp.]|nr:MAG: class I SAM-dependent methyltransferase [Sphingobium sp.]